MRTLVSLFDSVVVIASVASVLLCTRSVYRTLRLGRVCATGFTCVFDLIHSSCIDGDSCCCCCYCCGGGDGGGDGVDRLQIDQLVTRVKITPPLR